jgi:glycosyltransferase involved in cell wall biosynthesis
MIKVMFICDDVPIGGHEIMAGNFANKLAELSHLKIYFSGNLAFCSYLKKKIQFIPNKYRVRRLSGSIGLFFFTDYLKYFLTIRRVNPNIVIVCQGTIELGIKAVIISRIMGIPTYSYLPIIINLIDTNSKWLPSLRNKINKYLYFLPNYFITISTDNIEKLLLIRNNINVFLLQNWISLKEKRQFNKCESNLINIKINGLIKQEKLIIGLFGRIAFKHKQQDLFFIEYSKREHNNRFHFLIAGDGPDFDALKRLVSELNLADSVTFLGACGYLHLIYKKLNGLVICSSQEGVPLVALEAVLSGVKIFTFNFPGLSKYVHNIDKFEIQDFNSLIDDLLNHDYSKIFNPKSIPAIMPIDSEIEAIYKSFNYD